MLTNAQIIEFASSHSIIISVVFIVLAVGGIYFFVERREAELPNN